jgi:hypothetical protein
MDTGGRDTGVISAVDGESVDGVEGTKRRARVVVPWVRGGVSECPQVIIQT